MSTNRRYGGRSADGAESTAVTRSGATEPTVAEPTVAEPTDGEVEHTRQVARQKASKRDVLLGAAGGVVATLVVLALAAYVWPGFLAGPAKPDDQAAAAVAALASKDAGQLERISCHGPDGKPVAQMPPQALALIQAAKQTGPPQLVLDTQAGAPISLTPSLQGQTQTLPVELVLAVTNGQWCLDGISQQPSPR